MAKAKKKKNTKLISPFKNYWNAKNYIIFGTGLAVIIIGFILMAQPPWDNPISLSISPIVLLIAYIIIFPLSILYKNKNNPTSENVSSQS